ncbi:cytochrome c biogenesis protein CcsA [Dehalobacter sp. DCM]|uniref:cytochrome c biogenesis protein CcsA n=1 Tax=Dehalobacter sp. DCM TaxID=2907827 RepID=UPI0030813730|nr:cytochrome c biogenesis protein CcsA [Dehalobacter sp. DCM]
MMQQLLFGILIAYVAGAILYFVGNKTENTQVLKFASIAVAIGGVFNLLLLLYRWNLTGRPPLSSGSDFLLCFSFVTIVMYMVYELKSKDKKAGGVIMVFAFLFILSIFVLMANQLNNAGPVMPALKSPWLTVHVMTAVLAYAAFALAAGFSARNIIKKNDTTNGEKIYHIVAWGFAMLSLSIVLGAIWAEQIWGSYWSWDPKETWALITWIIYALYLHLHRNRNWQGKRANIIVLAGFILVLFTFFGVNFLMSGMHSYA